MFHFRCANAALVIHWKDTSLQPEGFYLQIAVVEVSQICGTSEQFQRQLEVVFIPYRGQKKSMQWIWRRVYVCVCDTCFCECSKKQ